MADYRFVYKGCGWSFDAMGRYSAKTRKPTSQTPLRSSLLPLTPTETRTPNLKTKPGFMTRLRSSSKILKMTPTLTTIASSMSTGSIFRLDDLFGLQETKRKKRLTEMETAAKLRRYGAVIPISGSDFVREVSQARPDVWVVVILYKDGYPECGLLLQCLEELATKYPATKFVKIIFTDCIPNYPDRNLPALLVYNNGAVKGNYVGLHSFGRKCTPEGVALVLCQTDPVLNDGQSGSEQSRKAILDGVRQRLIEKVMRDHEDDDDGSSD